MIHHTSGIRDYLVLMWLAGADDPDHYEVEEAMTMLARELQLAPSTLTRMVDPLVEKELIRRAASPEDRRVVVSARQAQLYRR